MFDTPSHRNYEANLDKIYHLCNTATVCLIVIVLKSFFCRRQVSLYHAHGAAIFEFIPALLTLEPSQIQRAQDALRHTFNLCSRERRNYSFVQSIGAIIKKVNVSIEYVYSLVHIISLIKANNYCN